MRAVCAIIVTPVSLTESANPIVRGENRIPFCFCEEEIGRGPGISAL
jgi:hypothetical protein